MVTSDGSENSAERDQADMERLISGHDAALNELMERHAARVYHFLYRMLNNEEDAQDLAQETFVRVYQHREKFSPGARFSTWLYTIAANLARNHQRWRVRHPNLSLDADAEETGRSLADVLPSPDAIPNENAATSERARAVRSAVEALPEEMREAIVLCEWEDLPVADAAVVASTTPKAIESRLYRARNLLRQSLRKWL